MPSRVARNLERNYRFTDRFKVRSKLFVPIQPVRQADRRAKELASFEDMCANGVSFVPEERLPPWKRVRRCWRRPR